ncbi:MAG: hypothetical protein NVSMB9_29620 [Isosphaeraceae bacterium]
MRMTLKGLARVRFELSDEGLCACCQCPLDRHQPDAEQPDRQLGTCGDCGTWFLIDSETGVMYSIPDVRSLRES